MLALQLGELSLGRSSSPRSTGRRSARTRRSTISSPRKPSPLPPRKTQPSRPLTQRSILPYLPEELLNLITTSLPTRNIDSIRKASKTLRRNVAPRNTNMAATKIAAVFRGRQPRINQSQWKILLDSARRHRIPPQFLTNRFKRLAKSGMLVFNGDPIRAHNGIEWDHNKKRQLVSQLIELYSGPPSPF